MILFIKNFSRMVLFSFALVIICNFSVQGSHGGEGSGISPVIGDEDVVYDFEVNRQPQPAQRTVEEFLSWSQNIRENVVGPYREDDSLKAHRLCANFVANHKNAQWYVSAFHPLFPPMDDKGMTCEQAMIILQEAQGLGRELVSFTGSLFALFSDDLINLGDGRGMIAKIDSWDTSFIEQKEGATPEEKKAMVRYMMLLIHGMSMEAYIAFSGLCLELDPVDIEVGSETERNYQKALLEAHESFDGDCHFNMHFLSAQTHFPKSLYSYEIFMMSLLDNLAGESISLVGHPFYSAGGSRARSE